MRQTDYNKLDDAELQKRISDRDQQAIDFVYRKNREMIRALVRKYNSSIDYQDIYQESMMVLVNTLYDNTLSCSISTFLYSVARNYLLKALRGVSVLDLEHVEPVVDEVEAYEVFEERKTALYKALNQLGEKCQAILKLFYLKSLNMDDIAVRLDYTNAANAKNQKYKCMKQLKNLINR